MGKERLRVEDLFPTAKALFQPPKRRGRPRRRLSAWLLLVAGAVLIGRRVRSWIGHRR